MTPVQLPLPTQFHANRQLFSDYYLNSILPQRPDWQAHVAALLPLREQLRKVLAAAPAGMNEAQTEERVVKPILSLLGHTFEIQAGLRTPFGLKKPDYVLYRDDARRIAMTDRELNADVLKDQLVAVGDAKRWGRALDVALKEAVETTGQISDNPVVQIAFYMRHSGAAWGVLTNGRLWRLYHRDTAESLDRHYEVDLPALLDGPPEAFAYFVGFFHRSAFDDHALGIAAILRESIQQARGISERLKEQVYEALRHLAQGFLDHGPNRLATDPAALKEIYDNCLIVLYRLLFVFYAEARELLPLRENETYRRTYSLAALVATARQGEARLAGTARLWQQLSDLFVIINEGSPPLQVATFNGGLFDGRRHTFLERAKVGDARLQAALVQLAVVGGQLVDYRDLGERHLGTIYEGLLEFHLQPVARTVDGFTVELVNDKGERHRTGSYYTPDFVVQYIVEQTLRPVLDAAVAGKASDAEQIAAILAINCIDPSMGSGHFPVAAMEFIARYIVAAGLRPPADAQGEADLAYWRRRVAQSCIYGVDLNPLAVDLAKLSLWLATAAKNRPLSFLDHHLRAGNALVGARASELDTTAAPAKKAPRSRNKVAAAEAGQLSLLDDAAFAGAIRSAVGSMWLIEGSAGRTVDEVKEQERVYETVRASLTERFAALADLATAAGFNQAPERSLWPSLAEYATKREGGTFATPAFERPLEQLQALKAAQRFFHWDLEFPEVFYDQHGRSLGPQAGFDAVVGNPPYVRQEQLGAVKPFFQAAFAETYHGMNDLYVYFYQQGLRLLRENGRMSYIVTNKWLRAGYGEGLRGFFAAQTAIERIVDFGHAPIFPGADVFPVIIVVEKPAAGAALGEREVQVTSFPREALKLVSLESYVARYSHPVPQRRLGRPAWSLEASGADDLMEKIRRAGVPLAEFAGVKPFYGIKTGYNEAFLIDTPTRERLVRDDPRSAEIIKPYLRGQDIKRWSPEWDGLWMIFARRGIDIDAYPAIKAHLLQFREGLEPKPKDWESEKWPGRKAGAYKWFEIQDSVDYWKLFEQPKMLYQVIQFYPQYAYDSSGLLHNDKGFFLPTTNPWLLAVLNSPLMWWHNWRHLPHLKDEALSPMGYLMEQLPIGPPTDAIRAEVEPAVERLIAIARAGQGARRDVLYWLKTEFGVAQAGQRLEAFAELSADAFVEEVRKRRPKALGKLSPAGLRALREGYAEQAAPAQQDRAEALGLERRLAELVNAAYGLTPAEVALMWETAPPRMPVGRAPKEA